MMFKLLGGFGLALASAVIFFVCCLLVAAGFYAIVQFGKAVIGGARETRADDKGPQ